MEEDDLPGARFFLEEGGFEPGEVLFPGGVGEGSVVGVGDPGGVAGDVDFGFGDGPDVDFSGGVGGLDEVHEGVAVEAFGSIEGVEGGGGDGVEFGEVVGGGGSVHGAEGVSYCLLVG